MKLTRILPFAAVVLTPAVAHAYIGPGAGISAIGTVVALIAAVLLAIVGFVWYPVKRLMNGRRKAQADASGNNGSAAQ